MFHIIASPEKPQYAYMIAKGPFRVLTSQEFDLSCFLLAVEYDTDWFSSGSSTPDRSSLRIVSVRKAALHKSTTRRHQSAAGGCVAPDCRTAPMKLQPYVRLLMKNNQAI